MYNSPCWHHLYCCVPQLSSIPPHVCWALPLACKVSVKWLRHVISQTSSLDRMSVFQMGFLSNLMTYCWVIGFLRYLLLDKLDVNLWKCKSRNCRLRCFTLFVLKALMHVSCMSGWARCVRAVMPVPGATSRSRRSCRLPTKVSCSWRTPLSTPLSSINSCKKCEGMFETCLSVSAKR